MPGCQSRSICKNCCESLETETDNESVEINGIFSDIDGNDVQMIDAISYIYGITLDDLLLLYNGDSMRQKNAPEQVEGSFNLCQSCALLLSHNYSAHKRFESLTNPFSLIHKLKSLRRQEIQNPFKVQNPSFNDSDEEDKDSLISEDKYKQQPNHITIENKYDISYSSNSESEFPSLAAASGPAITRTSPRLRQAAVKLDQRSDENINDVNYGKSNCPNPKTSSKITVKINKRENFQECDAPIARCNVYGNPIDSNSHHRCKVCGKRFKNYANYKYRHLPKHFRKHPQKAACDVCGKKVSQGYLKIHMDALHGDEDTKLKWRGFCKICGKNFAVLKIHMKVKHSKMKILQQELL